MYKFKDRQKVKHVMRSILISAALLILAYIVIVIYSTYNSTMAKLFENMDADVAADITAFLHKHRYEYKLDDDGRTLLVPKKIFYEIRMALAREGLPNDQDKAYEISRIKELIGYTDMNRYRKVVETELSRAIGTFKEIQKARIHINLSEQEEPSASVIVKLHPGVTLQQNQIRGIQHLVASTIENLKARNVAILDNEGNYLTRSPAVPAD